jgi:ribonucleoside-diphosphate reductase alpha chain
MPVRCQTGALARTVRTAIRQLDRVIDLNYYPIPATRRSNLRRRPVGLGVMGLQDVVFQLGWAFDAPAARAMSKRIAEAIYFHALSASVELAADKGRHPAFDETRAAAGELQFDTWGVTPDDPARWDALRAQIREVGLRNSLMIAIAPTATIASIAGCYECIEPQVSNLFKRETLSGDFIQINRYLVEALKKLGPAVLRDVPRRDQEHVDRRGGRFRNRPRRPREDVTRRAMDGVAARRVLRDRRFDRVE